MRMVRVVVVLVMCGCMTPVMRFGGGKTAKEAQHDQLSELMPVQLAVDGKWSGEVKTAKIRVWADDDYRAQNLRWQQTFGESLEYANAVLAPTFGVRLIAEYRSWSHHAPGTTLEDVAKALVAEDPDETVFAVVGLTSSLTLVSSTFEQLGVANLGGRHMVLRGYADVEERKAFESAFRDLRLDERESALEARRRHKTATVLLHELGHNLGVDHEPTDTIMNASYSHQAATFSQPARAVMLAEVDRRVNRPPTQPDSAPATTAKRDPASRASLTIHIISSGETVVGGKVIDEAALAKLLAETDRDTEILVVKARKAPSIALVDMVDRLKAAGLTRITIGSPEGQ